MGNNLLGKYQKQHWGIEDFGRGKSPTSKARHRRTIKKKALRCFINDLKKYENEK